MIREIPCLKKYPASGSSPAVPLALAQDDKVIAIARKIDQIKDLEKKYPQTAKALSLDVTNKVTIECAVQEGLKTFGRIDALVNNAGYGLTGSIEEVSGKEIRD